MQPHRKEQTVTARIARISRRSRWLGIGVALGALACAPHVRVETTAQPGVDFASFDTYAIVPPPDARTAVRDVLEREAREELDRRGYREVAIGESDLLVVLQAKAQPAERRIFAESPGGCCETQRYVEGTLVVEIFDARTSRNVWRGVGEVDVQSVSDRDLESAADHALKAILDELPTHASD